MYIYIYIYYIQYLSLYVYIYIYTYIYTHARVLGVAEVTGTTCRHVAHFARQSYPIRKVSIREFGRPTRADS